MYITAQGCRLRNDLYCVEWDVKLYYTIPCHQLALEVKQYCRLLLSFLLLLAQIPKCELKGGLLHPAAEQWAYIHNNNCIVLLCIFRILICQNCRMKKNGGSYSIALNIFYSLLLNIAFTVYNFILVILPATELLIFELVLITVLLFIIWEKCGNFIFCVKNIGHVKTFYLVHLKIMKKPMNTVRSGKCVSSHDRRGTSFCSLGKVHCCTVHDFCNFMLRTVAQILALCAIIAPAVLTVLFLF